MQKEYAEEVIYPQKDDLWTAFKLTPFNEVKVVILGQDPYHGPGQAHGLSFSVKPGVKTPPSLRNMFKELESRYRLCRSARRNAFGVGETRRAHVKYSA